MSIENPSTSAHNSANQVQGEIRALDPNVLQRRASDPCASVWVSASAGTGKTKVLTDRVLRLLLPQPDGTPGCDPHKILGLTFTKAAASEMALRINETLSQWAVMPLHSADQDGKDLMTALKNLLGRTPNDADINAARKCFAHVIDTPGRLKIMTIHSFCQSLLSRFPLEAKITPGFELIEDRSADDMLEQAKRAVLKKIANKHEDAGEYAPLCDAMARLSCQINEDQLNELISAIANERSQLSRIMAQNFGLDGYYTALCNMMGVMPGQSEEDILHRACQDDAFEKDDLIHCAQRMQGSKGKNDQKQSPIIMQYCRANPQQRIAMFDQYASAFITQKLVARLTLVTKAIADDTLDIMRQEAARVLQIIDMRRSAKCAQANRDLFALTQEILSEYARIKTRHNRLDFTDIIIKASDLLQNSGQWVQFKLDEGIDHILIDEAQDTNPEQWQIIEALCAEFFAQHSAQDKTRTIFTVGDEKQSIYSFQRASPEEFSRMQSYFARKITDANKTAQANWQKIDLNISFRSTKSVLAAVDAVFNIPKNRAGLSDDDIHHAAFRRGQAGKVEIWPLFTNDASDQANDDIWEPPTQLIENQSGTSKLADAIANRIAKMIKDKDILPSHDRPIQPGDIMILLRSRNALLRQLMRALKLRNVPVAGLDRIVLNNQIAVQDMMAVMQFALLPSDDYNLACLLKSPLIGCDEDQLFDLAHDRHTSLWQAVQDGASPVITTYLNTLRRLATTLSPYAFLATVLNMPCPHDAVSGLRAFQSRLGPDAVESLDELLNAALSYERDHVPSIQGFVQWQKTGGGDIKRQMEEQNNQVRIMTVHGSKGLQAPIVFLPDTTGVPGKGANNAGNRVLWPSQTGQALPIWAARSDGETATYTAAKDIVKDRLLEEYRRLLYVAMTRAENQLFIAGHQGKNDISDECWYRCVEQALQAHEDIECAEDGTLVLQNPQIHAADRQAKPDTTPPAMRDIPAWLYKPAPSEPTPPAPLMPSRPSGLDSSGLDMQAEPGAASPLQGQDNYRFRRGNVTHTLLQFLPNIPPDLRARKMHGYLESNAQDLPQSVRENIAEEINAILNHPDFTRIFSDKSRAEVPITGLLSDNRLISGQIDRLYIDDARQEILIIDYKSNRPPPRDAKDIPPAYYQQLRAYVDVLKTMYPDYTLRAALLWTDGPFLMDVIHEERGENA